MDPSTIGRLVQVTAGPTVLPRHERHWARHQIYTDPDPVKRAVELRRDYRTSMTTKPPRQAVVEEHDLCVYHEAFGIPAETGAESADHARAVL
ncbi:hypothetical protein [Arthrobacter sp. E3]|uniref:hypothetical protein n=1 Tax=Arthrobacter sp. E3 TaxID=517402 RepID=UPI001A93F65B|nr:hypothetical protein [Arthrobacter sp. E3]